MENDRRNLGRNILSTDFAIGRVQVGRKLVMFLVNIDNRAPSVLRVCMIWLHASKKPQDRKELVNQLSDFSARGIYCSCARTISSDHDHKPRSGALVFETALAPRLRSSAFAPSSGGVFSHQSGRECGHDSILEQRVVPRDRDINITQRQVNTK